MKNWVLYLTLMSIYTFCTGMEQIKEISSFSIKNGTQQEIKAVVNNKGVTSKYIVLSPGETKEQPDISSDDETIVYVFTTKSPKGRYDSGWSIVKGQKHIHCIVRKAHDAWNLRPNKLKQPNIVPEDITQISPRK